LKKIKFKLITIALVIRISNFITFSNLKKIFKISPKIPIKKTKQRNENDHKNSLKENNLPLQII
jgi:hypothetical protein